jgi:mannose/cellobiose epimerase-like protein (N-acyl-D-glucosamine 2-epimerase family)
MSISPAAARDWLLGRAVPLWLEHGVDWRGGGFLESLDPATLRCAVNFRRLRVATRQVYVFARAAELGVARAGAAVELGLDFLRRHALQDDGGYAWRFDLANRPIDQTRDLYDHAFVLLACAATGEAAAARGVVAYLDAHFVHPLGGWRESLPDMLPRRQNPHMHLLEALLAAAERFGEADYLDRADALVALFLDRLFQAGEGALPEFYDAGLLPLREAGRFVWEPGHHCEWVWLLDEHRRISRRFGREARDTELVADELMAGADRVGLLPDGLIAGEIWSDGALRSAATRVWPHTERLKALARTGRAAELPQALGQLWRFFDGVPEGLWTERWDGGLCRGEPAPASTLYHLTCAILDISAP